MRASSTARLRTAWVTICGPPPPKLKALLSLEKVYACWSGLASLVLNLCLRDQGIDQRADGVAVVDLAQGRGGAVDDLVVFVFEHSNVGRGHAGPARFDEIFQAQVAEVVVGVGEREVDERVDGRAMVQVRRDFDPQPLEVRIVFAAECGDDRFGRLRVVDRQNLGMGLGGFVLAATGEPARAVVRSGWPNRPA